MQENKSVSRDPETRIKKLILGLFKDEPVKIILFGSRARKDHTPTSDVDIGILPLKKAVNTKTISLAKEKLENSTIPLKVDIVDLSGQSQTFINNIMKDSILWKT